MTICADPDAILAKGEALTDWVLGPTTQTRYDGPHETMTGEMDPFFFLTKTQNFIPHEYPCRTRFAAERRGRRPQAHGTLTPVANVIGFGADRLDLSGFWFRPTHLATWARTTVRSPGGPTRLTLATPGGAVLFVNGTEAGWLAPYTRNLDASCEIECDLPEGVSELKIFFDDLAERDTRYVVRLAYAGGTPLAPVVPFAGEAGTVAAVRHALEAMHFDRPAYRRGPVRLCLPEPLAGIAVATVTVEGDFMSHERLRLEREVPAGASTIEIADAAELPADFRHFTVLLTMGGFAAARTLGVEIAHDRPAPPAALAERIEEALNHVALHGEADTVRALARLATGRSGALTDEILSAALGPIEDCWDCADFAMVPLLWCRIAYEKEIGAATRARIDEVILGFRYWMDEPGNDVQWYFSENHALLFHTGAYLAGHLFPDRRFVRSGRLGSEQSAVGAERVRDWLDHFGRWEMAEFNSAPYFPIDLKGLAALYALAPDGDVRTRAGAAIERLVDIVANSAHQGVLTGTQGRSYEHTLRAGASLELSAIARLLWGRGGLGARFHALPQLALCLRDHELSLPDRSARALWRTDDEQEWCFRQGDGGIAGLYHAKSRDWAMGSAAHYRWFEWGYQETLVCARIGEDPEASVFLNHPGETRQCGYARPSYWGGSASVPRVQQYRGLAIVIFRGIAPQPDFTHAHFPHAAFDAVRLEETRAFAAKDGGALLLSASGPLEAVTSGPSAGVELRLPGREGVWLVRTGSGPLDDFAEHFAALSAPAARDGTIVVDDPQYGPVHFHADGTVEAEGRRIDPADWTIAGERRVREAATLR